MTEIIWTEQAKTDLKEIFAFFQRNSEDYAGALTDKLYYSTDRLQEFPSSGRMIPEFHAPHPVNLSLKIIAFYMKFPAILFRF